MARYSNFSDSQSFTYCLTGKLQALVYLTEILHDDFCLNLSTNSSESIPLLLRCHVLQVLLAVFKRASTIYDVGVFIDTRIE